VNRIDALGFRLPDIEPSPSGQHHRSSVFVNLQKRMTKLHTHNYGVLTHVFLVAEDLVDVGPSRPQWPGSFLTMHSADMGKMVWSAVTWSWPMCPLLSTNGRVSTLLDLLDTGKAVCRCLYPVQKRLKWPLSVCKHAKYRCLLILTDKSAICSKPVCLVVEHSTCVKQVFSDGLIFRLPEKTCFTRRQSFTVLMPPLNSITALVRPRLLFQPQGIHLLLRA
jgi:hypothetical protein